MSTLATLALTAHARGRSRTRLRDRLLLFSRGLVGPDTYPGPLTTDDQLAMYTYLLDGGHTEQSAAACLASHKAIPLQRYLLPLMLYPVSYTHLRAHET